jgi:hypothetical protein
VAVNDKRTHFGRAGEFYAMSELLLRGWNVAVPVVDVGDDVFVIDDNDKTTRRVQVKSSLAKREPGTNTSGVGFTLSRKQLQRGSRIPLIYMFMVREDEKWRFFVIPREQLFRLHNLYLQAPRSGPGRPPKSHGDARTDSLTLTINLDGEAQAWGASLAKFESAWPKDLPVLQDGPGTVLGKLP